MPLISVIGCFPQSKNNLPQYCLHEDDRILGRFWATGYDSEAKTDIKVFYNVEKIKGNKGEYLVKVFYGKKGENGKIYLFKIGGNVYCSMKVTKDSGFEFFRVKFGRNQMEFAGLSDDWFKKNPSALPSTTIKEASVNLNATPDQLYQFFLLHADTDGLIEPKPIATLNRIGP